MSRQIDAEQFVMLWMKAKKLGKTQLWIAQVLEISRAAVGFKATRLRALGVQLPDLKNNISTQLDTKKLNRMIANRT